MKITILTLFPEMFSGPFDHSIIRIAKEKGLVEIRFVNIRDFGIGNHKTVDDTEYGGGVGMVLRADVLCNAINFARNRAKSKKQKIVLLSATGKKYNQKVAKQFSKLDHLILVCGHYEGIDERIKHYVDEEVSVGDFILTGGEIPSMLIVDSVIRLIKNVLPKQATEDESFSEVENEILLEYPHYTKPRVFDGMEVPEILLKGNHPKIKEWRISKSREITGRLRPDLANYKKTK